MQSAQERRDHEMHVRKLFGSRYDEYVIGRPADGGRTIQSAVDMFQIQRGTNDPLFTKEMWEVIVKAKYRSKTDMANEHREYLARSKAKINELVVGINYSDRIARCAMTIVQQKGYAPEKAVERARVLVNNLMESNRMASEAARDSHD